MMQTRLCEVKGVVGYFHAWEHYSRPVEASPLRGGAPAGIFSKMFAIVEFSDGVERVDPENVIFRDETNAFLKEFNKKVEEKGETDA